MPLRLVCHATGNMITPRDLFHELSQTDPIFGAHMLDAYGTVTSISALDWRVLAQGLPSTTCSLKEELLQIPANTFLWFEELDNAYDHCYAPDRRCQFTPWTPGERASMAISRHVQVDDSMVSILWEGFANHLNQNITQYASPAPRQKTQRLQEDEIIQVLGRLGYDPMRLPKHSPGTKGAKHAARVAVGTRGTWAGSSVFDKAWDRLRSQGRIKDAP